VLEEADVIQRYVVLPDQDKDEFSVNVLVSVKLASHAGDVFAGSSGQSRHALRSWKCTR
jgi:DNA-binding Lrp family transcriptional regulator